MRILSSLKARAIAWVIAAMVMGMLAAGIWLQSVIAWERHLQASYVTGLQLFETLREDVAAPDGLKITVLSGPQANLASAGLFNRLPDVSASDFVTLLSFRMPQAGAQARNLVDTQASNRIAVAVVSPDLRYPVAKLNQRSQLSTGRKLAQLTQMLATYCATSLLYVQYEDLAWHRVNGNAIWGCANAPSDYRLPALALVVVSFGILVTLIISTSASFQNFTTALSHHGLLRSQRSYDVEGPDELRRMIKTMNSYLRVEQESLEKRAAFLSGVSHDLGTPATRLRLRAQSVESETLRTKMNKDIDQMTSMIESVLRYTQSEVQLEDLRQISLVSLVEAVVDDFQDAEQPVQFTAAHAPSLSAQTILFNAAPKSVSKKKLAHHNSVVINARPNSLRRALTNLIDNALKYGRKAELSVEATAQMASIHIDDYGDAMTADVLGDLTHPFVRGDNAQNISGHGIGLAIASTIAAQHGGRISFQTWEHGVRVTLAMPR